ncbi:MAG: hypothetical protein KF795_33815, partial [Labilithrix sp.]|nr:hypothetical protein [Labilithrix sp.]
QSKRPAEASGAPYRAAAPPSADGKSSDPVGGGAEVARRPVVMTPGRVVAVVATFHFVCFAWIFFRAPTFAHATLMLERMVKLSEGAPNLTPRILLVLALGLATHFIPRALYERIQGTFVRSPALVQGVLLAGCAYALHFAAGAKAEPFIYGQF